MKVVSCIKKVSIKGILDSMLTVDEKVIVSLYYAYQGAGLVGNSCPN
jgi:hypothetical protein